MEGMSIHAENLSKRYVLGRFESTYQRMRRVVGASAARETSWALRDVSFEIPEGQAVALIGHNGAGKSTLLKILSHIVEPTAGYADVKGRVGALLDVGTGFHGELTGRENVFLNGTILGMRRAEIRRRYDEIVEFSGIGKYIDTPVKRYSSGMYIRLGFAVSAFLEPEILIVDEVLAVGDAEFQKRCLGRMSEVAKGGRTVLFVSHNMQPVRTLCDRAIMLDHGRIVADGPTDAIIRSYLAAVDASESGVRRWPDPAMQPGNDDCRLVEVRVTDESGDTGSVFFSSRPVNLEFELDMRVPDPALIVSAEVVSPDGVTVFRSYSADAGERLRPGRRAGQLALRCTIPPRFLNGGRYLVNVRVLLRGVDHIINEQSALAFDVTADHGESYVAFQHARPGLVAPILEWEELAPQSAAGVTPGAAAANR
jgi:lipopolysaccharide transport system ATP-binding protein